MPTLITFGAPEGSPVRHALDVELHSQVVVHADDLTAVVDAFAENPDAWLAYGPDSCYPAAIGRLGGYTPARWRLLLTFAHDQTAQDSSVLWQAATVLAVNYVLDLAEPAAVNHLRNLLAEPLSG